MRTPPAFHVLGARYCQRPSSPDLQGSERALPIAVQDPELSAAPGLDCTSNTAVKGERI
jgi:hypothetical protein